MKARITANPNHKIAKAIASHFNTVVFCSRSSGFDIRDEEKRREFVLDTPNYDWTIGVCHGSGFNGVKLFLEVEQFCFHNQVRHHMLNFGSYNAFSLVNNPEWAYEIEKSTLKHASRRANVNECFHKGYLDSRIINFGWLSGTTKDFTEEFPHLNALDVESISNSVKYLLDRPNVKEMSIQYNQPGNHRINDGIGPLFAALH